MPAATKHLTEEDRLEAGATYVRTWKFVRTAGGPAHDLTAHTTWRARFRKNYDDSTFFDATITGPFDTTGTVTMQVSDAATAAYARSSAAAGRDGMQGVWDLESVNSGSGAVTRWLEGTWLMSEEATYDNP